MPGPVQRWLSAAVCASPSGPWVTKREVGLLALIPLPLRWPGGCVGGKGGGSGGGSGGGANWAIAEPACKAMASAAAAIVSFPR